MKWGPAALKRPTLDELYKRLRDLDYTQVDERLAVMLNAILQLEAQGECRESSTEAVLMVGYTTEGISNQEQTRWLSWNVDGGVRGFDLARNPRIEQHARIRCGRDPASYQTAGRIRRPIDEQPLVYDTVPADRGSVPGPQQFEEGTGKSPEGKRQSKSGQGWCKTREGLGESGDQAILESDQARRDLNMIRAEYQQEQKVRENEELKSQMEKIQR